jgi:hypothetical protein
LDTMLWMADALIEAALAQAKERKKARLNQKE